MASVPIFYSYRRSFTVHLRERGSTLFVKTGSWGSSYRTRTPNRVSQSSGLACRASGASGTSPTLTPYFQSGGQMAMKRNRCQAL